MEVVEQLILKEKPDSVLPTLGGQAGLNLAMELEDAGFFKEHNVRLIGTTALTIKKAEDREMFKETMVRHIRNGSADTYTVTPEDDARIREIAREQFQSWERIFGRSPKFTIDRTGRFAGGKVQFKLDVQKGLIRDAAVYGDFFSTLDADTLCAALLGCPYERGAVLEALQSHGIDGAVYRISAKELASVVVD